MGDADSRSQKRVLAWDKKKKKKSVILITFQIDL